VEGVFPKDGQVIVVAVEASEEMFSKVKEVLRRAGARAKDELYDASSEALWQVAPEDILAWFLHAGLCATHG
jgi:hypothetical protein